MQPYALQCWWELGEPFLVASPLSACLLLSCGSRRSKEGHTDLQKDACKCVAL